MSTAEQTQTSRESWRRRAEGVSLPRKLVILVLVVLIGVTSIVGVALHGFAQIDSAERQLTQTDRQILRLSRFRIAILDTVSSLDSFLLSGDQSGVARLLARNEDALSHFAEYRRTVEDNNRQQELYKILESEPVVAEFRRDIYKTTALAKKGDLTGAITMREAELRFGLRVIETFTTDVEDIMHIRAQDLNADMARLRNRIGPIIGFASVGVLIVSGLIILFVARSITGNSRTLVEGIQSVERGADNKLRLEVPKGPEFSVIAMAFNSLMDQVENSQRALERSHQELAESQQRLVQSERLSVLGQVTATISHEIRNPLGAIRNSLFTIGRTAAAKGWNVDRPLSRAERSVTRCDNIISDLLEYTRTKELTLRTVDGSEYLNELLDEQSLPDNVTLCRQLPVPGPRIAVDLDRFRRVIINLLENAAQTIAGDQADGGEIVITCESCGDGHAIRVKDNGPGIPDEVLDRIFEPLFTTKSFGAGLGLPTVKQVVEQHGAELLIETECGIGTTFSVVLPPVLTPSFQKEDQAA